MKLSSILFLLLLTSFYIGCSSIYSVSYDYDKNFELVQISTYDWLPIPKDANINNLDAVRIQEAVNTELKAKGLKLTSKDPDIMIAAHIVRKEKLRGTQRVYSDYYSYQTYRGSRTINYYQYQEGTFILDFVDPFSKNLIWHGSARVALDYANTPEKREKLIKEAMQRILQNYPPPSK